MSQDDLGTTPFDPAALAQVIIARIDKLSTGIFEEFAKVNARLTALETRMDSLETRMNALESHMNSLETRMNALEGRMNALETRMGGIEREMELLDRSFNKVAGSVFKSQSKQEEFDERLSNIESKKS
jgi:chromosome segregation ATPase